MRTLDQLRPVIDKNNEKERSNSINGGFSVQHRNQVKMNGNNRESAQPGLKDS